MSENAPEIQKLIDLYGRSGLAEKAARLSSGMFSKFRRGSETYSEKVKARVLAAIEAKEKGVEMEPLKHNSEPTIPDECPEEIAAIIKRKGSKSAAAKFFGSSEGAFYNVVRGKNPPPEGWLIKARAEMGLPVIGDNLRHEEKQPEEAAGPPIPEFVPWNGKMRIAVVASGKPGDKPKGAKFPVPIADLIDKFAGSRTNAAASIGYHAATLYAIGRDPNKFHLKLQQAVHAVLNGVPIQRDNRNAMGEEFDKYTLGLAIVMFSGEAAYDRINEIADILNGRLVFKKNTKGGWLVIYRMPQVEDLAKFKRLALRDANEIVCP